MVLLSTEFEQHGVSQQPDDPWIDKLAVKIGRLSLNDTNDLASTSLWKCFLVSISMILLKSFLDSSVLFHWTAISRLRCMTLSIVLPNSTYNPNPWMRLLLGSMLFGILITWPSLPRNLHAYLYEFLIFHSTRSCGLYFYPVLSLCFCSDYFDIFHGVVVACTIVELVWRDIVLFCLLPFCVWKFSWRLSIVMAIRSGSCFILGCSPSSTWICCRERPPVWLLHQDNDIGYRYNETTLVQEIQ